MRTRLIENRIRKAMSRYFDKGHTAKDLSKLIGSSPPSVSRMRNGQQVRAHGHVVDRLEEVLAPILHEMELREEGDAYAAKASARVLPVLASAYCSEVTYSPSLVDAIDMGSWDGETVAVENDGRRRMAFRAQGDSMNGAPSHIADGDIIIVDLDVPLINCIGKPVIVVYEDDTGNEQVMCKRLSRLDEKGIRLTSDGERGKVFDVPQSRLKFIWRATDKITSRLEME